MDDSPIKITLKSYNEPATIRVIECVDRFKIELKKNVKITSRFHNKEAECDVMVIEGDKESLLELAKYIEAIERLAKEWVLPVVGE